MTEQDKYDEKTSAYNEAKLQIERLHNAWVKAELYANSSSLMKWKFILDSVWREIFPDVFKHKNKEVWLREDKNIKDKIIQSTSNGEKYHYLNVRHQFLKYVQDSVGKGSKYEYLDDGLQE